MLFQAYEHNVNISYVTLNLNIFPHCARYSNVVRLKQAPYNSITMF